MNPRCRLFVIIINFNQVSTHAIAGFRNEFYQSCCIDSSGEVKKGLPLEDMSTVCKVPVKAPGLDNFSCFVLFLFKCYSKFFCNSK